MSSCTSNVIQDIFVVKKFSDSSKFTKIKQMKYFQRTYYIIERKLNYRTLQKFLAQTFTHEYILCANFPEIHYGNT